MIPRKVEENWRSVESLYQATKHFMFRRWICRTTRRGILVGENAMEHCFVGPRCWLSSANAIQLPRDLGHQEAAQHITAATCTVIMIRMIY